LVLAGRARLPIVGRTEVVPDLVRRDQRARERAEGRLRERDAEARRADDAEVRDADQLPGRVLHLVEIAAREEMREPALTERFVRELVRLELREKRARVGLGERAGRVDE